MDKEQQDPPVLCIISTGYPCRELVSGSVSVPGDHEIHLWFATCRDLDGDYETLSEFISCEERQTAGQFRKTTDARDYSLRHGYLRLVLGHYLGTEPSLVPLVIGNHGKPEVVNQGGHISLSFSLSHSRDSVALAVAGAVPVGIDIVQPDERYPFRDAAEYLFSPAEKEFMERGPADLQFRHFFRIWAIKEALLKAQGGTALMMRDIDVSGIAGRLSGNVRSPVCCHTGGQRFCLWGLAPGDGHYCAVAAGISGKNIPADSGKERFQSPDQKPDRG